MKWKEYKKLITPTIENHGDLQFYVLSTGLGAKLGELIKCDFEDCKKGTNDNTNRKIEFGNMLWYLAAIEVSYGLPDNLYSSMIDVKMNTPGLDKAELNSDLFKTTGNVILCMHSGDLQQLQFELNDLSAGLIDYADFHGLNTQECIQASLLKLNLRKQTGKRQPSIEYNAVKKMIKEVGKNELTVEMKTKNSVYDGISLKYKGEKNSFFVNDIIVDFFDASTFIANKYAGTGYILNFGPKIREFLKSQNKVISGFIIGENLVSSISLRKSGKVLIQGHQQTFFTPEMTILTELLDYINEYKKKITRA
jgi:hypothetical protein